jgi:hypothetical protein
VTPFSFEVDFRAPSPAAVFRAYFDPELTAEQDREVEVARREILEVEEAAETLRRVCNVVPRRQLPAIVRPFVAGDLSYREEVVWRKREDLIEMRIEPAILGGRVEITATYRVVARAPGVVRRSYTGQVSVQLRLLGPRIERAIVDDLGRSLKVAAACTQAWLDRHAAVLP